MSFQDFCKYFTTLEMCSLGPDTMSADDEMAKNQWSANQEAGQWVKRVNAGGCRNYLGIHYSAVAVLLWYFLNTVVVVLLQYYYSNVAVLLYRCCNTVSVLLGYCCTDVAVPL